MSSVRSSPFRPKRAESADARLTRSCSLRRDQDSLAGGAADGIRPRDTTLSRTETDDHARELSGHSSDSICESLSAICFFRSLAESLLLPPERDFLIGVIFGLSSFVTNFNYVTYRVS